MKLSGILKRESILQIENAPDKWSVIRTMVDTLTDSAFADDLDPAVKASLYEEIEQREKIGTTGLGEGIAFPHARINGLERPLIAFATIPNGVDFDAPDGKPAQLVFLFLHPAKRVELGVKINAICSRFLIRPEIRKALLDATSPEEIYQVMQQNNLEIDAPIIASDLMRNRRFRLTADLPLHEATQLMHRHRTVASPVVNASDEVVGELNCNTIFERELPDYIKHLHSVPHISDFKPFQNYFTNDAQATVGDFMNDCGSAIVEEDASLLEIIFQLSVQKQPLLYVCRDSKLIGVIDAVTVIDKVINL